MEKTLPGQRLEIVSRIDEGALRFRIVRDNETKKEFLVSIFSTVNGVSIDVKEL
jgi:hypothetical protein